MDLGSIIGDLQGGAGLAGSDVYEEGRSVWFAPARVREPTAVIRVKTTGDVAASIKWAKREGLRLSPRSGGHSFDGFPVASECVLLDLSGMDGVALDRGGCVTAQPGARAQTIAETLAPENRALPTGDCGSVALGGLLSGGGFGYSSRKFGLTIDSVRSATVVTGRGEILHASREVNPDVFWSCCGGGGSAGIVTEFQINSFTAERVTGFQLGWQWGRARAALELFSRILSESSDELDMKLKIRSTGSDRYVVSNETGPCHAVVGEPDIHIDGQFLGRQGEAEAQLAALLDHPAARNINIREQSYFATMVDLIPALEMNKPAPQNMRRFRVASDFLKSAPRDDDVSAIISFAEEVQYAPDLWGGCILLEPCDRAVGRHSSSATPFAHRGNFLLAQWEAIVPPVPSSRDTARVNRLLAKSRAALRPVLSGGRYLNYADELDTPELWWGPNLERVKAIAQACDPDRLFRSRLYP